MSAAKLMLAGATTRTPRGWNKVLGTHSVPRLSIKLLKCIEALQTVRWLCSCLVGPRCGPSWLGSHGTLSSRRPGQFGRVPILMLHYKHIRKCRHAEVQELPYRERTLSSAALRLPP